MAKRQPAKPKSPRKLPRPTAAEAAVLSHILNSIAFEDYGDCCSVDEIAKSLDRTPGRLTTTLKRLADKGYLTIEGRVFPTAYPTEAALRKQDPSLSEAAAQKLLRKLRRA
jgi:hypothetical protein